MRKKTNKFHHQASSTKKSRFNDEYGTYGDSSFMPVFFHEQYNDEDLDIFEDIWSHSLAGDVVDTRIMHAMGEGVKPTFELLRPNKIGDEKAQKKELEKYAPLLDELTIIDNKPKINFFNNLSDIATQAKVFGRSVLAYEPGGNITPIALKPIHPRFLGRVFIHQSDWTLSSVYTQTKLKQLTYEDEMIYLVNKKNSPRFRNMHYGYSDFQRIAGQARALREITEFDIIEIVKTMFAGYGIITVDQENLDDDEKIADQNRITSNLKPGAFSVIGKQGEKDIEFNQFKFDTDLAGLGILIDKLKKLEGNKQQQQPAVQQPDVAPQVNREHALANNQQLGVEEVPQKKKGGGGSDWKKKPTFGKSHNTFSQLIDDGFTFNGNIITITDNWHTDFAKTSSIIGDENHVRIVTYAADTLKSVSLSLGLPEIGAKAKAETSILLNLEHDYKADVLYSVSEIIHEQKEKLINEDKTKVNVSNVKCNENSNSKSCYAFDIFFTVMAPLSHDVLSITAVDNHRRTHTTFINEGVEFVGESLLDPEITKIFQKKSNQDKGNWLELIREDRRYNIWIDENGLLWEKNQYDSFNQITFADYAKADDKTKSVMNLLHLAFNGLIQSEADRAVLVWNSTSIQSQIGGSFAYELPTTYSNKLDDPKVINSLSQQEKLAMQQLNLD